MAEQAVSGEIKMMTWDELWASVPVPKPNEKLYEKYLEGEIERLQKSLGSFYIKVGLDTKLKTWEELWDSCEPNPNEKPYEKYLETKLSQLRKIVNSFVQCEKLIALEKKFNVGDLEGYIEYLIDEVETLKKANKILQKENPTCDNEKMFSTSTVISALEKAKKNKDLNLPHKVVTLDWSKLTTKGKIDKRYLKSADKKKTLPLKQDGRIDKGHQTSQDTSTPLNLTKRLQGGGDNGNFSMPLQEHTNQEEVEEAIKFQEAIEYIVMKYNPVNLDQNKLWSTFSLRRRDLFFKRRATPFTLHYADADGREGRVIFVEEYCGIGDKCLRFKTPYEKNAITEVKKNFKSIWYAGEYDFDYWVTILKEGVGNVEHPQTNGFTIVLKENKRDVPYQVEYHEEQKTTFEIKGAEKQISFYTPHSKQEWTTAKPEDIVTMYSYEYHMFPGRNPKDGLMSSIFKKYMEDIQKYEFPKKDKKKNTSTPLNLTKRLQGGADNGKQMQISTSNQMQIATSNLSVNNGENKIALLCKKKGVQMALCNPNLGMIQQVKQIESYKPHKFKVCAEVAAEGVAQQWYNNLRAVKQKIETDQKNMETVKKNACDTYAKEMNQLSNIRDKNSPEYFHKQGEISSIWKYMVSTFRNKTAEMQQAMEDIDKTMKWLLPKIKEDEIKLATREVMEVVDREMGYAQQYRIGFTTYVTQNGKRYWFEVNRQREWKAVTLDDCRNVHKKALWGKSRFDDEIKDKDYYKLLNSEIQAD
mmetsp:Transcript_32510/g.55215  ORF Transcript_32510/g.55215 Transcript_32510/m.55215 type:complete len:754 (+) Transcript_32510:181-2442(+)